MKFLIFGGTGSLGKTLVKRLFLENNEVAVFARGEDKHHKLKQKYPLVKNIIGDIRDYDAVLKAIICFNPDIIINASSLKQVPYAEEFIEEAVKTNINGTINICKAVEEATRDKSNATKVLLISTDKVCMPVNAYGMSKALQERLHIRAGDNSKNIYNVVRYGNVLESTGSVIPLFKQLLKNGKDITVTHPEMTRFLMSLDDAVDLIFKALNDNFGKRIFIPKIRSAKIVDLGKVLIEKYNSTRTINFSSIRPGEKLHEILISKDESNRTFWMEDGTYILTDIMNPEKNIQNGLIYKDIEYSSSHFNISENDLKEFLESKGVFDDLE